MNNIPIYVISLTRNPKQIIEFKNKNPNLNYNVFEAVDGIIENEKYEKLGINLKNKKCISCNLKIASYGLLRGKEEYCNSCKPNDNYINFKNKKCKTCNRIPSFGLLNGKVEYCNSCKPNDNYINLKNKKCFCGKFVPSFGFPKDDIYPEYCSVCKLDGMENIRCKKYTCHCGKCIPSFGFQNGKKIYCKDCKSDNMINLNYKICIICQNKQARFGFENDKKPSYCSFCKLENMTNLFDILCQSNKFGIKCDIRANKYYDNYYTHCFINTFPNDSRSLNVHMKSKENKVVSYILNLYKDFYNDKPLYVNLSGGCCTSKRRIDMRKLIGNTLLCIEIDENQHKQYDDTDEENRYDNLYLDFSGKYIFIRYNPDSYKKGKRKYNPSFDERMDELVKQINIHTKRIEKEENVDLVEIHHLYFDC
jgi:hypothetical protein